MLAFPQIDAPPEAKPFGEESRKALINRWTKRINAAKSKWKDDFDRMRENLAFVASLQWETQKKIRSPKYVANYTTRLIAQKVATLYAKNPVAVAQRRKRMDFALWDGKIETLVMAAQQIEQSLMMGLPPDMNAWAVIMDYERGRDWREQIDKVGETLETAYQYQLDTQEPEFKRSLKDLVWRTCVCGVGYVRVTFERNGIPASLLTSNTQETAPQRMKRAQEILGELSEGKLTDTAPELEELRQLLDAIEEVSDSTLQERLVLDFMPPTSIIPSPDTRNLRSFLGTRWLAQEYIFPAPFIKAHFGKDVKKGNGATEYNKQGQPSSVEEEETREQYYCVWDVISRDTKEQFVLCDGYDDYLQEPQPVFPELRRFWPVIPLVFNHVETEEGSDASPFPPSDVDLVWSAQKEHNRIRQALRSHRRANRPLYIAAKGVLDDEDKSRILEADDSEVIDLQAVPPGTDPETVIRGMPKLALDPMVYDAAPQTEDALMTTGTQEANLGPAQPNVTATVGTIAEQSRMTVAASNVDDLDDFLSVLAEAGGETLLRYMSPEVVSNIAGVGASWPSQDRQDFLNELLLQVVAASSGRPNKAMEVANWERLAPILLQSGANPQALIRETIRRADDRMEPDEFFPLPVLGAPAQQGASVMPQQPLQELPSESPMPLPGA